MSFFEILSTEAKPDRSEAVRIKPMTKSMGDEEARFGEAAAERISQKLTVLQYSNEVFCSDLRGTEQSKFSPL